MSSILKSLSFKNYKAFSEADIEIKPLTIFLGANSSGKSSILQLILALEQTINNKDTYSSPLKLNGHYVNLGEDINVIKDKDRANTLSIEIGLERNTISKFFETTFDSSFGQIIESTHNRILTYAYIQSFKEQKLHNIDKELDIFFKKLIDELYDKLSKDNTKYISIDKKFPTLYRDTYYNNKIKSLKTIKPKPIDITDYFNSNNDPSDKDYIPKKTEEKTMPSRELNVDSNSDYNKNKYPYIYKYISEHGQKITLSKLHSTPNSTDSNNTLMEALRAMTLDQSASAIETIVGYYYEFQSLLKKQSNIRICYELYNRPRTKRLSIRQYYLKIDDTQVIGFDFPQSDTILKNTIKGIPIEEEKIKIKPSFSGLQILSNLDSNLNVRFVHSILFSAYQALELSFESDKISYVGPLRAHPQRYYFLDESNSSHSYDAQSGQRLAEILKRDKDLVKKINRWLKEFEINISVNEFKDIIHNIKITQNSLKLDITDVGFGYSQILPILVQTYRSKKDSLTIIEQPEIHLHPKMQAALADLFIEIITPDSPKGITKKTTSSSKQKTLLIETHSEYMLKRLRRRIAEGKISNNDIAIYFIESRNNTNTDSAKVRRVNVSKMGDIDWPKDFYITSVDDNIAFLEKKIQYSNE